MKRLISIGLVSVLLLNLAAPLLAAQQALQMGAPIPSISPGEAAALTKLDPDQRALIQQARPYVRRSAGLLVVDPRANTLLGSESRTFLRSSVAYVNGR